MQSERRGVPCNGCTLCCQRDLIPIATDLGDDAEQYETEPAGDTGLRMLKRAANGDCIYLDRKSGCTIYDRRPAVCKAFDCAAAYKRAGAAGRAAALANGTASKAVFDRGHQLLKAGYRPNDTTIRRLLAGMKARRPTMNIGDRVRLIRDIPEMSLTAGTEGFLTSIHQADDSSYFFEFPNAPCPVAVTQHELPRWIEKISSVEPKRKSAPPETSETGVIESAVIKE